MPRPVTKSDLMILGEANFKKLMEFISSLPEDYREKTYDNDELNDRDKRISDVICHLHEWHNMLQNWYQLGMSGSKPKIPAEGITWQTLPILNHRIFEMYQHTGLADALELLAKSHQHMMDLIAGHSDEELFTKKKYAWTGTTSLGAYFISATSSHYDWALKTIKPIRKFIK